MTIKYLDSKRLNGVASDTKPTDIQDNSIFVETDTARRYWFDEDKLSTTGLKAYYNFDSIGGGTTLTNQATTGDGLGSSADGVNTSVTLDTTNEKLGTGCYSLNGSSSKVVLGSASDWNFLSSATANIWSIVWWMKYDDTLENGHTIMSTTDGSTQTDGMFIDNSGSGTIRLIQVDGNNGSWTSAIPDNTSWHHYAITWNAGTVTLYVDGVSKGTQSQTAGSGTPQYALNLGANNDQYYTALTLDDMSIWSRVLTSSEISILYNSGTGSTIPAKGATWTKEVKAQTPAQIGDLKVHYDATVGVTASSNSVSAWADQSGNGKTLSSVSNPTRVQAGQNGKDYLDFNSSKSMRATGLSETAPRPFTMVAVINPRNAGSQTIIRWSQSNYLALYQNTADTYYMSGGSTVSLTDSTLDGSWNAFFMDFKSNADGGTLQINDDTANAVSGTLGTNGTSGTTATLHVGINADNNNWYGNCRYAEIIIFNKVLTAEEKADLYAHLKTKWGLT